MKKLLVGISIALSFAILLFIAFYLLVYNKPHVDYIKAEVDIEVSGEKLFMDFKRDALSAAKKYNGKVLLVSGKVNYIENEDDLNIAVMVFDEGFFGDEGVRLNLQKGQEKSLKIGGSNKIKGFCAGYTEADVIIEHASILD